MAIYVKNKEGIMESYKIVGLKGENGVTPNISIGTVTTLESGQQATVTREGTNENPIFNFGIPKGEKGDGGTGGDSNDGASIDDSTISTKKTWSSSKIENFVLTNNNTIWKDVNGENLSIEYTKEGYFREVEIWGNTVQGYANLITNEQLANSVNSVTWVKAFAGINPLVNFDGDTFEFNDFCGSTQREVLEDIKNSENVQPIKLEPNTTYSLCLKNSNITNFNVYSKTKHLGTQVFTTDSTGDAIIIITGAHNGRHHIKLVKGNVPNLSKLDWDYDLEHIESLGQLHTNRLGEPILDNQGRKQYKVDIVVSSANLGEYELEIGALNYNTGLNVDDNTKFRTKDFIKLDNWLIDSHQNITNNYEYNDVFTYIFYNKDKKYIGWRNFTQLKEVEIPIGTKYFKFYTLYGEKVLDRETFQSNVWYSKKPKESYCESKRHKTTILTPCQLMKVGNIADRLYWDSSKGRYVIEKNISDKFKITSFGFRDEVGYAGYYTQYGMKPQLTGIVNVGNLHQLGLISNITTGTGTATKTDDVAIAWGNGDFRLLVNKSKVTDEAEAVNYFNSFNPYVYYPLQKPQLIETNITEELKLPTYINNTYISVSGGIQGSIKAKAPVDGGKVIKTLQRENIELKATNDTQDGLINTTMLATDEMFMMLEPLLAEVVNLNGRDSGGSPIMNMYVAMIQRGIKTIESVPVSIRDCVADILGNKDGKQDIT